MLPEREIQNNLALETVKAAVTRLQRANIPGISDMAGEAWQRVGKEINITFGQFEQDRFGEQTRFQLLLGEGPKVFVPTLTIDTDRVLSNANETALMADFVRTAAVITQFPTDYGKPLFDVYKEGVAKEIEFLERANIPHLTYDPRDDERH